ncbi:GH39 family glycosyl hydrolase [Cryobacterium zongtaii]|uniref:GH39 family glycosyl hydrolase n=1 Tax=Cryobacterium zongtaii TaxID=1259217 RepID=UPI0013FDD8E0|nr:discoidin domain-containing protein [Cryobacterium zongtaii]
MYPPQPAFAPSPIPSGADDVPTAEATTMTMLADYSSKGTPLDTGVLLNGSQGAYPPTRNLHWLTSQAAQISAMGINEIRIDDVFNDASYDVINVGGNGEIQYDFSKLDSVLLPLIDNGITPFIVLSYMPLAFAPSHHELPSTTILWTDAVSELVSHYVLLGHAGWSYEVWNEPDTEKWSGSIADYNEFYAASADAVNTADPKAKVGGSATSGIHSAGNWSGSFIDYLGANPEVPADFFSFHNYRVPNWDDVSEVQGWLDQAGRGSVPIYVTEWNNISFMDHGPGQGSDTNSSVDGSSFIAAQMYRALGSGVAKVFYFSPVEGLNYRSPYNGDLGLITVDGHRKSAGNVFEMYSRLDSVLIDSDISGEGSATQDVYGLLTKNAKEATAEAILWNNTASDVVSSVSLQGLPYADSKFRVTEKVVSAAKGNAFSDGYNFISPAYPSANENAPVVSDEIIAGAATFERQIRVPANGVVSLSLSASDEAVGQLVISAPPAAINLASTQSGAVATASSSIEAVNEDWGVAGVTDGRRHAFEPRQPAVRGWSSELRSEPIGAESITIDLGATKPVDSMVLWPRDSQAYNGAGFPIDFTVRGSQDNITWEPLYSATNYNDGKVVEGPQTISLPPGEFRYLKVEATALAVAETTPQTQYAFQLTELEAYRTGVSNGGFESSALDGWTFKGVASAESSTVRSGKYSLALSGKGAAASMFVKGLLPDTTYTFGGHVRSESKVGAVTVAVSGTGTDDVSQDVRSTNWRPAWVTFTTGHDATSATISVTKRGAQGLAWADDFLLTQKAE